MDPRTFFIGDVHGCLDELKELTDTLNISSKDSVILLGDLINRGPFPAETLNFVYKNGFSAVAGNHELDYMRRFESDLRYRELRENLDNSVHEWILNLPFFLETKDYIAVHAGFEPGRKPDDTSPEILTTIRTWDGKGRNLRDPMNPPWYDFYSDPKTAVYGHWAKAGLNIRKNTIGLDSGCVYGNFLSAWELETGFLTQVKARRIYQPVGLLY